MNWQLSLELSPFEFNISFHRMTDIFWYVLSQYQTKNVHQVSDSIYDDIPELACLEIRLFSFPFWFFFVQSTKPKTICRVKKVFPKITEHETKKQTPFKAKSTSMLCGALRHKVSRQNRKIETLMRLFSIFQRFSVESWKKTQKKKHFEVFPRLEKLKNGVNRSIRPGM